METQVLTGLTAHPRGYFHLKNLYSKILHLSEKVPENCAYRKNLETIICYKLSMLHKAGDDRKEIEDNIGCGSLETLILQAKAEFALLQRMIVWKPWEPLKERPPHNQWDWPPKQQTQPPT